MKAKEIVNELLVQVFNHILDIEAKTLKDRGIDLSMTEVHVLEAIQLSPTPTMTHVASRLRVTVGTLTIGIQTLVRKKYVEREKDGQDKRKVVLKLTPIAYDVLKIHQSFHEDMIDSILKDLRIEEDQVLIKSLENINEYFKKKY